MYLKIKNSEIKVTKDLVKNFNENKELIQPLIDLQCSSFELTINFIKEFKEYITKENFSKSPNLRKTLIDFFPELFEISLWKQSEAKNLDLLLDDDFIKKFKLNNDDIFEIIKNAPRSSISKQLFDKFINEKDEKITSYLFSISKIFGKEIEEIKDIDLITEEIFSNNSEISPEKIEEILLGKKEITFSFFVKALLKISDLGYKLKFIDNYKKYNFIIKNEMINSELKKLMNGLPDEYIEIIFEIGNQFNKLSFSFIVLEYFLNQFSPSEKFLIKNKDLFIKAGLRENLRKIIEKNNYKKLKI